MHVQFKNFVTRKFLMYFVSCKLCLIYVSGHVFSPHAAVF